MIWLACLLMLQAAPDQVRFEQAQQLAAQGRCQEAEPLLKELFDAHPHSAPIEFVLGQCQFQEKDYLTASNTFRKVLELARKSGGSNLFMVRHSVCLEEPPMQLKN